MASDIPADIAHTPAEISRPQPRRFWLEHVGRAVALANASDSVVLLSVPGTSGKALSGQQGAL